MIRILALCAVLVFVGCSEHTESMGPTDPREQAQAALSTAQARYTASLDRGFAWRDALKHLEQAQTAFEAGDNTTALSAAQIATKLADLSIEQADAEAQAWKSRAPFGP